MNGQDAYEVLGVPRDARTPEIRKAYRRLALDHHPDRNPGDARAEARFKEIVIAYETLKDPKKRATYDTSSREARPPAARGDFDEEWEDIFSQIFRGGGREKKRASPASERRDLQARVDISFEDTVKGTGREVSVKRLVLCRRCRGKGTDPDAEPAECRLCGGTGEVKFRRGLAELSIPCGTCMGEGRAVGEKCPECRSARAPPRRRANPGKSARCGRGGHPAPGARQGGRGRRENRRSVRHRPAQAAQNIHPLGQRHPLSPAHHL
ncbi:MAG: DnaJ domain-containing protein, partial [bacterium]